MQVVFYASARQIGASANLAAISAGLMHYFKIPVYLGTAQASEEMRSDKIFLKEGGAVPQTEESFSSCDLLVLNLAIPCQELSYVCFRHFFVRENVMFLVGKYHKNQSEQLKQFLRYYRVEASKLCTVPYNLRFAKAYEDRQVFSYVAGSRGRDKSCEDYIFEKQLRQTVKKLLIYANRKGEINYG